MPVEGGFPLTRDDMVTLIPASLEIVTVQMRGGGISRNEKKKNNNNGNSIIINTCYMYSLLIITITIILCAT